MTADFEAAKCGCCDRPLANTTSAVLHLYTCNGTGSHSCSMGSRSMPRLTPRSHDTCGVQRNQKPQRKVLTASLPRVNDPLRFLPGAGQGSSSFLKGLDAIVSAIVTVSARAPHAPPTRQHEPDQRPSLRASTPHLRIMHLGLFRGPLLFGKTRNRIASMKLKSLFQTSHE